MANGMRISVKQIKQSLETQVALDKVNLEQYQHASPSLDSMREMEHSRARLKLCREYLMHFWGDKPEVAQATGEDVGAKKKYEVTRCKSKKGKLLSKTKRANTSR